jgi:hypothetical protein
MIRITHEDGCVACGKPCIGSACSYGQIEICTYFCDMCGKEVDEDEVYETENGEFCEECFLAYVDEDSEVEDED